MGDFSRSHSAYPGCQFFTRLNRCRESQSVSDGLWNGLSCLLSALWVGQKWTQSKTNLKWSLCAQGEKSPTILRPQDNPQRPLGGDSVREGQMWDLILKAVHLPQTWVFVEVGEWRSSAKMARDTGSPSLCEVFSTLLDLKERKRKRKVSMLPSLPSTLRSLEKKVWGQKSKEINGTL